MKSSEGLLERELDIEMADVLSHRETLGLVTISTPTITVVPTIGVAIAVQAVTNHSNNVAWLSQYVHA